MSCKEIKECRICFNDNLYLVIDLGNQPLANDYHDNTQKLTEYPLKLNLCTKCYHLQLSHAVDSNILYKNYQYVSGTSKTLYKYFEWLAEKITRETNGKNILEIACNDGTQLNIFKKLNWDTYGVDPAVNIVKNINNEHKIFNDFFSLNFAKTYLPNAKFDVILAQNVLAHLHDVHDIIQGCKYLMNENSTLYIQTSQCNMIMNNEFDTIYHEHHSFFNVKSMDTLLKMNDMYLHKVEKTDIHGTSFLFTIKTTQCSLDQFNRLNSIINEESENGLYNITTYKKYANNVEKVCTNLISTLSMYKDDGYKIIGYGAAAKGNTLLNYIKFKLDYILDDSDIKFNLYTPGMNIPIFPNTHMVQDCILGKLIILPLAWNFFNEIREKVINITPENCNILFIKYFPSIEIIPRNIVKTRDDIKLTLVSHFYNEQYLLPFWLQHHKNMFDHGILIDYNSTDDSVNIIKSIVPDWTIIKSRNDMFDAVKCDEEVIDIEKTITGWKIALNTTEFLCCTNIKEFIYKLDPDVMSICIKCIPMVESDIHEHNTLLSYGTSLVKQRTYGIKNAVRHTRTIHRSENAKYCVGRHYSHAFPAYMSSLYEIVVLWYGFSPWNQDIIKRKLQIQNKIPESDKQQNFGKEHVTTSDKLYSTYKSYLPFIKDFKYDTELAHHFLPDTFLCWK